MKTTEDFIKEMEHRNMLMSREYTFKEYAAELLQFQSMICRMIAGDAYYENMRIEEASFIMEAAARKKALRTHPAVCNGILTMKKLAKEIAIVMSGAKGEHLVSKTLEFLNRPNTRVYRNVYITDGIDETEIDDIVLTDDGVIILEVKKVKSDITITEDGRLVFSGDECYGKAPLAEKMALKRRLLKKCLEQAVAEKGLSIPIYIDSFIVFSAPKDRYIRIDDRYHREKHCFRTGLNKKIESYLGCAYYKDEDLNALGEVLSSLEANVKRFEPASNYNEVRLSIAEMMAVLQCDTEDEHIPAMAAENVVKFDALHATMTPQMAHKVATAASILAGLLISGAVVALSMNGHGTKCG